MEAVMHRTLVSKFLKFVALGLSLSLALAGCAPLSPSGGGKTLQSKVRRDLAPQIPAADAESLARGNRAFALDFYQAVSAQDGNLFFSPYSLSVALAMTYAGARGATAEQMAETLHFTLPQERLHPAFNGLDLALASRGEGARDKDKQAFQLNAANSLWGQVDYAFTPEFLDLLAQNYGAGLRLVDFANAPEPARQEINDWVEKQTEGRIEDLVPQGAIDSMTRLALANAIYFKADWLTPFSADDTRNQPFYMLDGGEVMVPMMSYGQNEPTSFPYAAGDGYQAVEIPYVGEAVSMLVIVPDSGRFAEFEAGLDANQMEAIQAALEIQSVNLRLPKFSFESEFALRGTLAAMGMPDAFDPGQADFSGMDGSRALFVDDVFHKAFVAVDEKGTEAAAATAVIMQLSALVREGIELNVDRPFIFAIVDNPSGVVLFLGRVLDPTG
jgi:serpin B